MLGELSMLPDLILNFIIFCRRPNEGPWHEQHCPKE